MPDFAPTGAVPIAQLVTPIPVPQDLICGEANSNSTSAIVWQVWNDAYTQTLSITSHIIQAPSIVTTPNSSLTNASIMNSAAVWNAWNAMFQSTVASTVINQPLTTATAISVATQAQEVLWKAWNQVYQTQLDIRNATAEQVRETHRRATEEQQRREQERQRQQREHRETQARIQIERSAAEKRAERLLQTALSAAQREELAAKGFFTLRTLSKNGEERIYRIRRGRSRNVEQIDAAGNRLKTLCAHPVAAVPDADTMLAQKLMLEDDEESFLRIANHS